MLQIKRVFKIQCIQRKNNVYTMLVYAEVKKKKKIK